MPDRDTTIDRHTTVAPGSPGAAAIGRRTVVRRRRRLQLAGIALVVYGLIGIAIFAVVAVSVGRPLERAQRLSESVDDQRAALVDALEEAETTISTMSEGVDGMDASLGEAKAATGRASQIASGVAASMYQLRDAMTISILGAQPLIGLAPGFEQTGQQLDLLGQDLTSVGEALDANRADVTTTADGLTDLAASVRELTDAVREGPAVALSASTLQAVRMAIYAVTGWMALLAVGCLVAGLYMFRIGRPQQE